MACVRGVRGSGQVLPADGMNINQLNIKEAVAAGCSAARLARASALPPSGNPGLAALRDRGASVLQLLEFGFKERDALRAGFPAHAVVAASQHELHKLRCARCVRCLHTRALPQHEAQDCVGILCVGMHTRVPP